MESPSTEPRPVLPRVFGAAVTGAVLATGAGRYLSWVTHRRDQACESDGVLCFTWWDLTAIPLTVTIALIVVITVYKRLNIRPRLVVVPPTVVLSPLPLVAAHTAAGWWSAAAAGAAWSGALALAAWSRYRVLGLSTSVTLLLASFAVLYL